MGERAASCCFLRKMEAVPNYIVGESEMEANNAGRNLLDFKYACVGYSVFLDNKDNKNETGDDQAELPFCAGLEELLGPLSACRAAQFGRCMPERWKPPS
ncbi:hypothetical protein KSP39_PZI022471 [Platanthera zijinensis]|uniref:DUF8204 domain-containing protein n=1 Tax=Platanthera zijinensis TaxID=2320716 RepID=A0AAP0AUK8_9ASPA